jgi:hypothetical protein
MRRSFRRLFWLGLLGGGAFGAYRIWRQRQPAPTTAPQWPATSTEPAADVSAPTPAPLWLAPVNGTCPDGYTVKANDNSHIFHVPGGRFYARTVAERCYANAEDAVADGYRPAKA